MEPGDGSRSWVLNPKIAPLISASVALMKVLRGAYGDLLVGPCPVGFNAPQHAPPRRHSHYGMLNRAPGSAVGCGIADAGDPNAGIGRGLQSPMDPNLNGVGPTRG